MVLAPSAVDRLAELVGALTGADPSSSTLAVRDAGTAEDRPDPLAVVARAVVRLHRSPAPPAPEAPPLTLPRRRPAGAVA